MNVRSIQEFPPALWNQDTIAVWWFYEPRALKDATTGGYLEHACEFEVRSGAALKPHSHHTHEFYYVINGKGIVTINEESREVYQGDFVHIPPDALHTLKTISSHAPIRVFAFAIGLPDTPRVKYPPE